VGLSEGMKVKTSLRVSILGTKILGIVLPILVILLVLFPNTLLAIIAGVTAFTFVGEVINIVYIKWKARHNPEFLEEKIK
jgi:hypothetical protein